MIGKILPIFECLKNENFHNQLTATDEIIKQYILQLLSSF